MPPSVIESQPMEVLSENKELSEREIEVVRLLAAGLSNKEIAGQLVLSVNTVKVHLRNIFAKLDVQSRTEATLVAIQRGWVSLPLSTPLQLDAAQVSGAISQPVATPADIPRLVIEPPLPMWRRVVLIAAAIVCAVGIVVSGVRASGSAAINGDVFSDRPVEANPALPSSGDTLWKNAAPMLTPRTRLAVAAVGSRLVAIGGDTQTGVTDAVEWFDPLTGNWTPGASKPAAASNVSAAVVGDQVYVAGGMTSAGVPTTTVDVYDANADTWSRLASLPAPRMAYASAAFDGKVYVFGGWDGSAYSEKVFVFDPTSGVWSSRAPMLAPRGFAAAAVAEQAIYVVGGFDGQVESSACERYLPREDRWETCPSMSVGRGGLALVSLGSSLYAIGGGWTGYLAFNEVLATGGDAWRTIPTPFTGQWRGLGAAIINSDIVAVGGWNGQYLAVTQQYSPFPFKIFVPAAQDGAP